MSIKQQKTEEIKTTRAANTLNLKLRDYIATDYEITKRLLVYYGKNNISRSALYSRVARGMQSKKHAEEFLKHAGQLLKVLELQQKAELVKNITKKYFVLTPLREWEHNQYATEIAKILFTKGARYVAPAMQSIFNENIYPRPKPEELMELFLGDLSSCDFIVLGMRYGVMQEMDSVIALNSMLESPKKIITVCEPKELKACL